MSRKIRRDVQSGLALRHSGKAGDLLAAGAHACGKMRHIAPGIISLYLDRELGDGYRAQQVGRQARNVREPQRRRRAFDAARGERNRRTAVLMVRMPGAARQIGR